MADAPRFHNYEATLVRVIDADTVVLDLDLGFHAWRHVQSYRLLHVNAPEMGTPEGRAAREALVQYLKGKALSVHTEKSDHFGRYLVDLYADGQSVSEWLVLMGHAVPYR